MVPQAWELRPAHLQRATILIIKSHPQATEFISEESDVKDRIVGNEDAVPHERAKPVKYVFRPRLAVKHFVRNPVHMCSRPRDLFYRVYEAVKFTDVGFSLKCYGPDLDDSVASRQKTRCFNVHDYVTMHLCFVKHFWNSLIPDYLFPIHIRTLNRH